MLRDTSYLRQSVDIQHWQHSIRAVWLLAIRHFLRSILGFVAEACHRASRVLFFYLKRVDLFLRVVDFSFDAYKFSSNGSGADGLRQTMFHKLCKEASGRTFSSPFDLRYASLSGIPYNEVRS